MPPKKKSHQPPVKSPGLLDQYIQANFSSLPVDDLLNGHVLFLFLRNNRSFPSTIQALLEKTSVTVPRRTLALLINKTINKFTHFQRDTEKEALRKICMEKFNLPSPNPPSVAASISSLSVPEASLPSTSLSCMMDDLLSPATIQVSPPFSTAPVPPPSLTAQVSPPFSTTLVSPPSSTAPVLPPSPTAPVSPPSSTTLVSPPSSTLLVSPPSTTRHSSRKDPLTPRKQRLRTRLDYVAESRSSMKKTYTNKLRRMREQLSKSISRSHHNQAIRRKVDTINKLRRERREHQSSDVERQLGEQLRNLRRKHHRLKLKKSTFSATKSSLPDVQKINEQANKLKEKDDIIKALQYEKVILQDTVEELRADITPSKHDGKTYSSSTRMLVYDALVQQVPTTNIPSLLQSWSSRMGVAMTDVPIRQTVENMAIELGVISSLQVAEIAMNTSNLTLGFDATTQEEKHINSIHFTTIDKCVVVAIDELAGGTASDYERHICDSIDELALLYSMFNNVEYLLCRSKIISNISNTMTDRVNVNHATIERIKLIWDKELNELNCHLHPLDTIASSCRTALKGLEIHRGALLGNNCMAANIVLQMNKMRYKAGKGDPKGFVVFLDDNDLPRGILPRYRGNRLHILFDICGKLVQHHSLFLEFLTTGAVSCGGLQSSLCEDFAHPTARLEMQVLGLLGKLLSGPWMQAFYTSAADQLSHIDGINAVKNVVSVLKECHFDPIGIFYRRTNFFGAVLDDDDPCLQQLRTFPSDPVLQQLLADMMSACLEAVIAVLERQYKRYFNMALTGDLREQTQSARSHNIDAEEVMGMFSAAQQRSPGATLCYLSSRMRAKKNRTVQYLDDMDSERRENLVRWAVGKGRKRRVQTRKSQKNLRTEMSRRVAEKRQKKTEKEMRALQRRLRGVDLDKLSQEFPDLESSAVSDLYDILSGRVVGRKICHTWYDSSTQGKIVYSGHVVEVNKKNGEKYVVAYWCDEESELDNPVDYDVSKFELGVDLIYQDLMLC